MNAFILNKKYGKNKLSHIAYCEYIAMYLLKQGQINDCNILQQDDQLISHERLIGKHFLEQLPDTVEGKKAIPLSCKVCFVGKSLSKQKKLSMWRKMTSY